MPPPAPATKRKSKAGLLGVLAVLLLLALGGAGWYLVSSGILSFGLSADDDREMLMNLTPEEQARFEQERIAAMYDAADYIEWPVITLSGMVAIDQPEKQSAILNGHLITLQQTIDDARLIEVRSDGAVLEYQNTRKIIRVGEST